MAVGTGSALRGGDFDTHAQGRAQLAAANLQGFFQAVIGGDQVERGKPAPDIYWRAAAALGVAAENCGVFEDSEPGLGAAHAAGARVVWIPDLAPVTRSAQKLASARAGSLREVAEFLKKRGS